MKVFAFALLFLAAAGIADDQPAVPRGNVLPDGGIVIIPPSSAPASSRYFICPKDETVVRVGRGTPSGELLCPVDGAKMKAGTGRQKSIYLLR